MSCLLAYTENYGRGGGNTYMIDFVNGIASRFGRVVLGSNPGGLYEHDLARLAIDVETRVVQIVAEGRAWADWGESRPERAARAIRLIRRFEGLAFRYNVAQLRRLIRDVRPTTILAFNGGYPAAPSVRAMTVAAHREGVPVLLSVVSMPEPRREWRVEGDRVEDALVWASVAGVIINARAIAPALTETHDMPAGLAHVVRNGLPDRPRPREREGTPGEGLIACVGRLEPPKGTEPLVEAFVKVAEERPGARLLLVGEGRSRDWAVATLQQHGLADRAELPGWSDADIDDLLAGVDVFVFPSLWEGFPYSVLEAMRASLPIVATAVGGVPDAIEDGVTGVLVPPGSSEDLARAITRLLDDPEERSRLGRAARDRYEREFTLDRMAEAARNVLDETGVAP